MFLVKVSMQINLLKKIVEEIAGEPAVKIVDLLYGKKDINEFLIAKKLELTINQTRNLLYKLAHSGIISSIRKKDKRKGWYIYFWTFNVQKSLEVLAQAINNEINMLNAQLQSKKLKRFYKCALCGREVNEETALISDFICTECGEVYGLADNTPVIAELSKKIDKLQKEADSLVLEIGMEQQKKDKRLVKFLKKEQHTKKKLRMEKLQKSRLIREKEKKRLGKLNKKSVKKPTKNLTKKIAKKHKKSKR